MSRAVCGICWCPYDEETGDCACPPANVQKSTQQPEALRLADELRHVIKYSDSEHWDTLNEVVYELRRLHAELERCRKALAATSECWRGDADRWATQRDALLEVLKNIERSTYDSMTATLARAAIKAAEENT